METRTEEIENPKCPVCGETVDLEDLHPDSLDIPDEGEWYAKHVDCPEDFRAWIVWK